MYESVDSFKKLRDDLKTRLQEVRSEEAAILEALGEEPKEVRKKPGPKPGSRRKPKVEAPE